MRRLMFVVVCAFTLLLAASASAQPTVVTINGSPLTVIVGSDTSFQLINSAFPNTGQIFPGGCLNSVADAGVFASINGTLYGPDFATHPCGSAAIQPTPWTPVSMSGVTGTGTSADPFKIAVVVDAGTTGVRLTATFSYVNGDGFYRLTKTFCSATQTVAMNVYIGADIYLAGSDTGIPYLEPTSSSPGGRDCANSGYTILLVPTTPADRYTARGFGTVWSEISTQGDLSNIVDSGSGCIDNGAALEWKRTVAAGSCVTITSASSFGAIPSITQFSVGSVTPNTGNPGQTMTVTISGIGFQSGTTFNFGAGITVNSTTIVNSSTATVNITISPTATPGPRDVTGTQSPSSGLTSTAPGAFTVGGSVTCPSAPTVNAPRAGLPSGTITWTGTADFFTLFFGQGRNGCSTPAGTTTGNSFRYANLAPNTSYTFRVEANTTGCPTVSSTCVTISTGTSCAAPAPTLLAPTSGATNVASPITFKWSNEGAASYTLYISENQKPYRAAGTTTGTQLTVDVESGPLSWFVFATFSCGATSRSGFGSFNAVPGCGTPDAPLPRAVALVRSNEKYHLLWNAVANADQYEYDVATSPSFTDAKTTTTSNLGVELSQSVAKATAFYFRVRAKNTACNTISPNSPTVRTVVVPEDSSTSSEFMLQAEFGTVTPISQQVLVKPPAGSLGISAVTRFTATTDQPWLSVTPANGTMPGEGVLLTVTADPRGRPAGSSTATLIVTTETTATATTPKVTVPVSISLATPVTPAQSTKPSDNSLIIPAVAHVDGLASTWRSDIRVANLGSAANTLRLILSLTTGAGVTVNEAAAEVAPGKTLALDDVVKNWFGFGPLGDGANGVLEIRPSDPALSRSLTAALSRTYDAAPNGTLGQFIPAIPFSKFLGGTSSSLVVQPVTQSSTYRTNFGFVEAAGNPATILARLFDATGKELFSQTFAMKGGDQLQLSGLLAQQNISVTNGWLDVALQSTGGKVTAYGSVVDNRTADGTLVIGVDAKSGASSRHVVPGVGRASGANWQSDITILNRGSDPVDATLTFSAQGSADRPTATVHIDPQQLKVLDNVVESLFGAKNALGSLIVDTPAAAPLVVEGRTFNNRPDGTVGQALSAFTPADAVSASGRALQILNIEESERYRSNLGLAEVSGKPATVEVTAFNAEALASPTITVQLAANEFVQLSSILKQLGFDRTYNGRISVSVVGGTGSVAAYVSSVDNRTDDPTYMPGQ